METMGWPVGEKENMVLAETEIFPQPYEESEHSLELITNADL